MKRLSWKTTLCGIIGLLLLGAAKTPGCPDWLCHILGLLGGAAPSVGLLFARDNNRTSEDVGAKAKLNGTPTIIMSLPQPSTPPPDQPSNPPGYPTKPNPPGYPEPAPPKDEPAKPPAPSPKTV